MVVRMHTGGDENVCTLLNGKNTKNLPRGLNDLTMSEIMLVQERSCTLARQRREAPQKARHW